MKTFAGGCACGAIRYEVTAEPIVMFNCHCRDCQKTTGGPYTPIFYVPAKAFKVTKGSPKYYNTTSEMAGENQRGFCPECGSRYKPQFEIWTSDAQPWDHMDPNLPKFEKYQPS